MDKVKEKIVSLVPDVIGTWKNAFTGDIERRERPITLPDILRAIGENPFETNHYDIEIIGQQLRFHGEWKDGDIFNVKWNLTADYDGQTQEVKEFLGRLLDV